MESGQDMQTNAQPVGMPMNNAPVANTMAQGVGEKKKKNNGMLIGLVLCILLAAGGIGFGVWAMMDGNNRMAKKDEQISELQTQNSELMEKLSDEDNEKIIDDDANNVNAVINPVIKSTNSEEIYGIHFNSSLVNGNNLVSISIIDGGVEECYIGQREYLESGGYSTKKINDCNITGLNGEIYNIIEFGAGHDNGFNNIGFVMTDGTVKYIPLYDSIENNNFAIRGDVNIDGKVVNLFDIAVSPANGQVGGYRSSVFVLDDGSYIKFDESMLNS